MPTVGVFAAIFDERGRILCVRRAYGPENWTTPGGRMESGESPIEALEREVHEEAGYRVQARKLVGIYAAPFKDDMVLFIEAEITGRDDWRANDEIAEVRFFGWDELPQPMTPQTRQRIEDAFDGQAGIIHVFEPE